MLLLHIDSEKDAHIIDKHIQDGKQMFIIVYMVGCGPCNATRPEWEKMGNALSKRYVNDSNLVIADVNKDFMPLIKNIGNVDGFPTMKYIAENGQKVEAYEDSNINTKDRSVDSFVNWVESKILDGKIVSATPVSTPQHVYDRLTRKMMRNKNKKNKSKLTKKPNSKKNKKTRKNKSGKR
jgi:hypothetical protein